MAAEKENKMREIKIEKVVLSIGSGTETEGAERAVLLLNKLSGSKAVKTIARKRIATWKLRPGLHIGAMVTVRGKKADELLKLLLQAIENEIKKTSFTNNGFSFGIKEYIDIPGIKYDAKIGIIGLNVTVALKRAGYRVKNRKLCQTKLPKHHEINAEEAASFAQQKLGVKLKAED